MKKLIIIGASGHGKVVADIASKNGYDEICFLDDDDKVTECGGYPIIGKSSTYIKFDSDIIVAIGNSKIREKILKKLEDSSKNIPILVHPNTTIADNVTIGRGTVIVAGAVINPGTIIGKGCIINTCSSVDHDCCIGDYVHISVGAHVSGTVNIGKSSWIGAGATVSNNIDICEDCMIGAGAVVVKTIGMSGTYIGIPARRKQ